MRKKIVFTKNPATLPDATHEDLKTETARYLAEQLQNHKDTRSVVESTLKTSISTAKTRSDSITAFHTHHVDRLKAGFASEEALRVQLEQHLDNRYKKQEKEKNPNAPVIWGPPKKDVVVTLVPSTPNKYSVTCTVAKTATACTVGTLLVDDARFVLSESQPKDALNLVYLRSDRAPREYIGYTHGAEQLFVRRYVIRGLNQDDSYRLSRNENLRSVKSDSEITENEMANSEHTGRFKLKKGTELSLAAQILSHTRGWSKRFVSTTLTSKAVISTQGEEFRSLFGVVLIDLAYVDPKTIFDIHTPTSVQRYGLLGGDLVKLPSTASADKRTIEHERQLAVLDTVRTREVLLKGYVPYAAVLHANGGKVIVGVYDRQGTDNASQRFSSIVSIWQSKDIFHSSWERLPYRYENYEWKFFLFSDTATAKRACDLANVEIDKTDGPNFSGAELFETFTFPNPMPIGAK